MKFAIADDHDLEQFQISGEAIDVVCKSGYRKSYQNVVRCVAGSQTSPASLPTCNGRILVLDLET